MRWVLLAAVLGLVRSRVAVGWLPLVVPPVGARVVAAVPLVAVVPVAALPGAAWAAPVRPVVAVARADDATTSGRRTNCSPTTPTGSTAKRAARVC